MLATGLARLMPDGPKSHMFAIMLGAGLVYGPPLKAELQRIRAENKAEEEAAASLTKGLED